MACDHACDMVKFEMSHSQVRGAFYFKRRGFNTISYWADRPVLLDYRPAGCVTTPASNTGRSASCEVLTC